MHTEFFCEYFKEFGVFIDRKDMVGNIALGRISKMHYVVKMVTGTTSSGSRITGFLDFFHRPIF
jgi:hypothetical protein